MTDDLIDDSGFELGLPSREEMLNHQCDLLCSELDVTRRDLRQAHKNLAGVICMWRTSTKELAALRLEHERLRWTGIVQTSCSHYHDLTYRTVRPWKVLGILRR